MHIPICLLSIISVMNVFVFFKKKILYKNMNKIVYIIGICVYMKLN